MNKLKVLYDVARAAKSKAVMAGVLTANISKDEATVFSIKNEFEKNMLTGQTKAIINTDFCPPAGRCGFHGFAPGMRQHGGHHGGHHGGRCGGLKGHFSRLAFALALLQAVEIEEQESNGAVISLEAAKLPDDMRELVRERIKHSGALHGRHGLMRELCSLEQSDFKVRLHITASHDIEKIQAEFTGSGRDERQEQHTIAASAQVVFLFEGKPAGNAS